MLRQLVADLVYPPVIAAIKTFWKVLGLRFDFSGEENIPRKDGAILAINHVSYLDFAITGTAALLRGAMCDLWQRRKSLKTN